MNKKKFLLILLFLSVFCSERHLYSQNNKEQNIRYCLDLTINKEMLGSLMNQQMANMLEMPPEVAQLFLDIIIEEINLDEIKNDLIPVYDEFFTEKEIASLVEFYQSETGEKFVKVQNPLDFTINQFLLDYTLNELPEIVSAGHRAFQTAARIDSLFTVARNYQYNEAYESSLEVLDLIEREYIPDFVQSYFLTRNRSLIIEVNQLKYEINYHLENNHDAIKNLQAIINYYPECDFCFEGLASLFMRIEDYQGVVDALTKAISLEDSPPDHYYTKRALAKDFLGDFAGADADYDTSLSLTREYYYADRLIDISWNKYLVSQYKKCIEYSDLALEAKPDRIEAGYIKALSNLCLGNPDTAFELFKKYKDLGGNSYYADEPNNKAIENLKALIAKDNKAAEARKILTEVFHQTASDLDH